MKVRAVNLLLSRERGYTFIEGINVATKLFKLTNRSYLHTKGI